MKSHRSDSQKAADKAYEAKRSSKRRLSGYLDDDDAQLLDEAIAEFGSMKAAVVGALKFWKNSKNMP